jgi:hypothetical protein
MKTLSKIAVLLPLFAAACGGATHSDFRAAAAREMECSLSMDARSSALQVQEKVAAVLEGNVNPCGDAVDLRSASVALARIDRGDEGEITLVFHVTSPDYKPYNTP